MTMNAPWVRLTMFMIPQTRENPSATSARIPERRTELTAIWASSAPLIREVIGVRWKVSGTRAPTPCLPYHLPPTTHDLPFVPGRHRVHRALLRDVERPDRVLVPVG